MPWLCRFKSMRYRATSPRLVQESSRGTPGLCHSGNIRDGDSTFGIGGPRPGWNKPTTRVATVGLAFAVAAAITGISGRGGGRDREQAGRWISC